MATKNEEDETYEPSEPEDEKPQLLPMINETGEEADLPDEFKLQKLNLIVQETSDSHPAFTDQANQLLGRVEQKGVRDSLNFAY